jgi:glycosyltransferase involved in cell wall biosynthesis
VKPKTQNPLVSIIIPTYNRAHLIGETLDSVLAQTYTNWECIVVDDGSKDGTDEVIERYVAKDTRFKYYHRPADRLKGANACRNIGLENCTGSYVVFFDSDDLMTPDHLEVKVTGMIEYNCDYVITKTAFINNEKEIGTNNYRFDIYSITPYNYVTQAINWLTYDICLLRVIAVKIRFNENLQSGQEYNYFSKLVHLTVNAHFLDCVVTLRRIHNQSIRNLLDTSTKRLNASFKARWLTFIDIKKIADKRTRLALLNKCILIVHQRKNIPEHQQIKFIKAVFDEYNWRGFYFLIMLISLKITGKGYIFYQKLTLKAFK